MSKIDIFAIHDYIEDGKSFEDFLKDTELERAKTPKVTEENWKSVWNRVAEKCSDGDAWIDYLIHMAEGCKRHLVKCLEALNEEGVYPKNPELYKVLRDSIG